MSKRRLKCPLAKRKTRKYVLRICWRVSFRSDVKVELYGQKGGEKTEEGKKKEDERKADIMLDKTSPFKDCHQGLIHGALLVRGGVK